MRTMPRSLKRVTKNQNADGSPTLSDDADTRLYVFQKEVLNERVEVLYRDEVSENKYSRTKVSLGDTSPLMKKERALFRQWYGGIVKDVHMVKDPVTRKVQAVHLIDYFDGEREWVDFGQLYRTGTLRFVDAKLPKVLYYYMDAERDYISDTDDEQTECVAFKEKNNRKKRRKPTARVHHVINKTETVPCEEANSLMEGGIPIAIEVDDDDEDDEETVDVACI